MGRLIGGLLDNESPFGRIMLKCFLIIGANILFINEKKLTKSVITDENRPDYIVHRFVDILDIPILGGVR